MLADQPPSDSKQVLTEPQATEALKYPNSVRDWYWSETLKWEPRAWRLQVVVLSLSSIITIVAALPLAENETAKWVKWSIV
jgi:hypothetical protein